MRKTGGGINESDPLSELELRANCLSVLEKKVIRLLGATALTGIKGGLDTSEIVNEREDSSLAEESTTINLVISPSPQTPDNYQEMSANMTVTEVIEIPSNQKRRKRKLNENDFGSDSIAMKMLETQIDIRNSLLELVNIQKQILEIKKQKLELFKLNSNIISNVNYYTENSENLN